MRPPPPKISRLQLWALRLNRRQTRALVGGVLLCLFFAIRPYWYFQITNEVGGSRREPGEFAFVSSPPLYHSNFIRAEARIHWGIFAVSELICAAVTAAFMAALRDKNAEASATYGQYR